MGTPAWQLRSYEQQEFVRSLAALVHKETDKRNAVPFYELAYKRNTYPSYVFEVLRELLRRSLIESQSKNILLVDDLMLRIKNFSRVPSEEGFLICLLVKELMPTVESALMHPYNVELLEDPQRVIGAPSLTHEFE